MIQLQVVEEVLDFLEEVLLVADSQVEDLVEEEEAPGSKKGNYNEVNPKMDTTKKDNSRFHFLSFFDFNLVVL